MPSGNQGSLTVGQNVPNFLGLGTQRTLTLVNGQRLPPGNFITGLAVDLNTIPDALVDRVETIAVGGAPVYGSDAIAGTVNVILKDDFDGIDFFATTGTAEGFSDANKSRYGVTWGRNFGQGRGNVAVAVQRMTTSGIRATDRQLTATSTSFAPPADPNSTFEFVLYEDLVLAQASVNGQALFFGNRFAFNLFGNGIPFDIADPDLPLGQFDPDGNWAPYVIGAPTGSPLAKVGGDGLSIATLNSLYSDTERSSLTVFSDYGLTESLNLHLEAWLITADSNQIISQPIYNASAFGGLPANNYGNVGSGPIPILIDNPYLNQTARTAVTAALNVVHDFNNDGLAEPTIDTDGVGIPDAVGFWRGGGLAGVVGDDDFGQEQEARRLVIGLDGERRLGDRNFVWDVAYTYGENVNDNYGRAIHQPNFEQAIQVVVDGNGNPACADPSNGCVPLNVIGLPSQAAVEFVSQRVASPTEITQQVLSANISGAAFQLPAGTMDFAAGVSYRREEIEHTIDVLSQAGVNRFVADSLIGRFSSRELYAEAVVPLLGGDMDTPGVESLDFETAVRYVDNSIGGSDTTWTAGFRYRPLADLEVRGNVTEAIRAPSILEMFLPTAQISAFASDPCDFRFIDQGDTPAQRAANCAADGITQPFQSVIVNASQQGTLTGNTDLNNEVAESRTYGVIFRPRWLQAFTVSFDWFDIEIEDAIENFSLNQILTACYDSSEFASEAACGQFQRDAAGQIADFRTGYINVGRIEFRGRQSVLSYFKDLGRLGDLNLNVTHMYTSERRFLPGAGNDFDAAGVIGFPQHKLNLNTIWHIGNWTWFNQARWIDDSVFDNSFEPGDLDVPGVGDWTVVDSTLGYRLNDKYNLRLTVENLFDREPALAAMAAGNVGLRTYFPGVIGRFATFGISGSF